MIYKLKLWLRSRKMQHYRKSLLNRDCSIISMNCVGGCMCHDMGIRFNSPTISLSINADDFVKFCENIKWYLRQELEFLNNHEYTYPVAKLGDITIYFVHYKSNKEAVESWKKRIKRINWNNIWFMMCERDGCTYEIMEKFDKLPYKKVIFTHKIYENIKCSYTIKGFERQKEIGNIIDFKPYRFTRYYDCFDFISWLNNKND